MYLFARYYTDVFEEGKCNTIATLVVSLSKYCYKNGTYRKLKYEKNVLLENCCKSFPPFPFFVFFRFKICDILEAKNETDQNT